MSEKKRKNPSSTPLEKLPSASEERLRIAREQLAAAEKEANNAFEDRYDQNFSDLSKSHPAPLAMVADAFDNFIVDEKLEIDPNLNHILNSPLQNGRYGKAFSIRMLTKDGREYEYALHVSSLKGPEHNYLSLSFINKSSDPPTVYTTKMRRFRDQSFPGNLVYVDQKGVAIQTEREKEKNPHPFKASMIPLPENLVDRIKASFSTGKEKTDEEVVRQSIWDEGDELWTAFQIAIFDRAMQLVKLKVLSFFLAHTPESRLEEDIGLNSQVIVLVKQGLRQIDASPNGW